MIFWWTKAERSDLEGKNLRLLRGRFVAFLARESTVLYPFMAGDPNKNYVLCEGGQ